MIDPERFVKEFVSYWEHFSGLVETCPPVAREVLTSHAEPPIFLAGILPCVKARLIARHTAAVVLLQQLTD